MKRVAEFKEKLRNLLEEYNASIEHYHYGDVDIAGYSTCDIDSKLRIGNYTESLNDSDLYSTSEYLQ